jgi:hypothetical protein
MRTDIRFLFTENAKTTEIVRRMQVQHGGSFSSRSKFFKWMASNDEELPYMMRRDPKGH